MTRAILIQFALVLVLCTTSPSSAQVTGTVIDGATLNPVVDALVTLQATTTRTSTDAAGFFDLNASGPDLLIVAAAPGYFNASVTVTTPSPPLQIALTPVPSGDDPGYTLLDPTSCGSCHPTQLAEWTGSPMSKAGTNTWLYDIYDGSGTAGGLGGFVYTRDSVHAAENPNSECASCHQPEPWIANPFSALESLPNLSPAAERGVSCEVCHKIAAVDVAQINYPGIVDELTTFTRPSNLALGQVQYGVLGDTDFTSTGLMRASYQPQLLAEVCGTCHQDKNDPDGDGDFSEPNGVISEPTYLEWAASPYSDPASPSFATCVECHMPPSGVDQVCNSLVPALLRDPATIRSHDILGTTPFYLENAVELTMDVQTVGDSIEVEVSVFNHQTGHHVPTGVTIRNMILLVEVSRAEDGLKLPSTGNQVVHDLGGIGDPATGNYAGLPGKFFSKVNHAANGAGPTFFTDATGIQFDSRIPALATDTTNYSFSIPGNGGTMEVRARLIYRRSFKFLTDAKGWQQDGHGNPLADVAAPHYGHLMEEATESVALPFSEPTLLRGDVNGDGVLELEDALALLEYQFVGGATPACLDSADLDDNGAIQLGDAIFLVRYIFVAGSSSPPSPGPLICGEDPSLDSLSPCADSSCF